MPAPSFKPTTKQRREVEILAALRMAEHAIALAIGIDAKTLRKHFRTELDVGMAKRQAEVLLAVHRAALRGSASAQRLALQRMAEPVDSPPRKVRQVPLGKKEVAAIASETAGAGTTWQDVLGGVN